LIHLAEEQWGGPGFAAWASRALSAPLTESRFLVINGVAWPIVLIVCCAAVIRPAARWPVLVVAAVLTLNGVLHILGSLGTWSYSPGFISGALVYLPLGISTLRRGRDTVSPGAFVGALLAGVVLHAMVAIVAFGAGR
jgi:uncharacterized membrane protein (DUF2068 family)